MKIERGTQVMTKTQHQVCKLLMNLRHHHENDSAVVPIPSEQIHETALLKELGLNSISFIQLIVGLEKEFEIEFDDEDMDLESFTTIESLAAYIDKKRHVSSS